MFSLSDIYLFPLICTLSINIDKAGRMCCVIVTSLRILVIAPVIIYNKIFSMVKRSLLQWKKNTILLLKMLKSRWSLNPERVIHVRERIIKSKCELLPHNVTYSPRCSTHQCDWKLPSMTETWNRSAWNNIMILGTAEFLSLKRYQHIIIIWGSIKIL